MNDDEIERLLAETAASLVYAEGQKEVDKEMGESSDGFLSNNTILQQNTTFLTENVKKVKELSKEIDVLNNKMEQLDSVNNGLKTKRRLRDIVDLSNESNKDYQDAIGAINFIERPRKDRQYNYVWKAASSKDMVEFDGGHSYISANSIQRHTPYSQPDISFLSEEEKTLLNKFITSMTNLSFSDFLKLSDDKKMLRLYGETGINYNPYSKEGEKLSAYFTGGMADLVRNQNLYLVKISKDLVNIGTKMKDLTENDYKKINKYAESKGFHNLPQRNNESVIEYFTRNDPVVDTIVNKQNNFNTRVGRTDFFTGKIAVVDKDDMEVRSEYLRKPGVSGLSSFDRALKKAGFSGRRNNEYSNTDIHIYDKLDYKVEGEIKNFQEDLIKTFNEATVLLGNEYKEVFKNLKLPISVNGNGTFTDNTTKEIFNSPTELYSYLIDKSEPETQKVWNAAREGFDKFSDKFFFSGEGGSVHGPGFYFLEDAFLDKRYYNKFRRGGGIKGDNEHNYGTEMMYNEVPGDKYLINEDLTFPYQPPAVKKGLINLYNKYKDSPYFTLPIHNKDTFDYQDGRSLYNELYKAIAIEANDGVYKKNYSRDLELSRAVRKEFRDNGIKGISYTGNLDDKGKVIFSEDDITTLARYRDEVPPTEFVEDHIDDEQVGNFIKRTDELTRALLDKIAIVNRITGKTFGIDNNGQFLGENAYGMHADLTWHNNTDKRESERNFIAIMSNAILGEYNSSVDKSNKIVENTNSIIPDIYEVAEQYGLQYVIPDDETRKIFNTKKDFLIDNETALVKELSQVSPDVAENFIRSILNETEDKIKELIRQSNSLRGFDALTVYRSGRSDDPLHGGGHKRRDGSIIDSGAWWSEDEELAKDFLKGGRDVYKIDIDRSKLVNVKDSYGRFWNDLNYYGMDNTANRDEALAMVSRYNELAPKITEYRTAAREGRNGPFSYEEFSVYNKELKDIIEKMISINKDITDPRSFSKDYNLYNNSDFVPKTTDLISQALQVYNDASGVYYEGVKESGGSVGQLSTNNEKVDSIVLNIQKLAENGLYESVDKSAFDGNNFVKSIAEVVKDKIIQGISGGIASGSFVVGPSMEAADVKHVQDMILTKDGHLIETSPEDTLVALKNPGLSLGKDEQYLRNEERDVIGIINTDTLDKLKTINEQILHFEKITNNREKFSQEAELRKAKENILSEASVNYKWASLHGSAGAGSVASTTNNISASDKLEKYFREEFIKTGLKTFSDAEKLAYDTAKGAVEKFERDYKNPYKFVGYQNASETLTKMNELAENRAAFLGMKPRMATYSQDEIDRSKLLDNDSLLASFTAKMHKEYNALQVDLLASREKTLNSKIASYGKDYDTLDLLDYTLNRFLSMNRIDQGVNLNSFNQIMSAGVASISTASGLEDVVQRIMETVKELNDSLSKFARGATYTQPVADFSGYDSDTEALLAANKSRTDAAVEKYLAEEKLEKELAEKLEELGKINAGKIDAAIQQSDMQNKEVELTFLDAKSQDLYKSVYGSIDERRPKDGIVKFLENQKDKRIFAKDINEKYSDMGSYSSTDAMLREIELKYKNLESYYPYIYDKNSSRFAGVAEKDLKRNLETRRKELGDLGGWVLIQDNKSFEERLENSKKGIEQEPIYKISEHDVNGEPRYMEFTGTGLLGEVGYYKDFIDRLYEGFNNEDTSVEEKARLSELATQANRKYIESLLEVIKYLDIATEETKSGVEENKKEFKDARQKVSDNKWGQVDYDYWKYALVRDNDEQDLYDANMPKYFGTTGKLKESFLKTVFNKSVGYRQRQGLVGFAADMGYAKSGTLLSIGWGAMATAVTKATRAIGDFAKEAVKSYAEIQSVRTNLGIVYGSQSEADTTFNEIAKYAVKSPFGVQTVSEYAVLLKQSGIYASDLMTTLKQIGDVAGGNQQKFANIANSFSQIEANGRATTRQLRQFATAGIPIYKELSKELGKSTENIRKMTEDGKITSDIIEKVFANMTGKGGIFENAVNIGAKTLKSRQQNLADARQLAGSELGSFLFNFAGTNGKDSFGQSLLSWQENFFSGVQKFFKDLNTTRNKNYIKLQTEQLEYLKNSYDIVNQIAGSNVKQEFLLGQIKDAYNNFSPDQARAYALDTVTTYSTKYGVTDISGEDNIISSEMKKKLQNDIKNFDRYYFSGNDIKKKGDDQLYNDLSDKSVDVSEYISAMIAAQDASRTLKESYSKRDWNKYINKVGEADNERAMIAMANTYLSNGFETIDKAMNKNSKSVYLSYQKGQQAYEQTTLGKDEKLKKDIADWNKMLETEKRVRSLFDEQGRLQKSFNGTIEDIIEAFNSGILNPVENIGLKPENLARDYAYNLTGDPGADKKEIERRKQDWNYIMGNVANLDVVKQAYNKDSYIYKELDKFQDFTSKLSNTEKDIAKFSSRFDKLVQLFEKKGLKDLSNIVASITTRKELNPENRDYWTAHGNDVDPLWRRVTSSTLGVDATLMRRLNINAYEALNLSSRQAQRSLIQNILKSTLSATGNSELIKNRFDYGNLTNQYDKTRGFNWEKTAKSMSDFALALGTSVEVTKSFVSSTESEIDALTNFYSQALTTTENGGNIFDAKYEPYLKNLFESIKATDVQAYDLLVDSSGHLRDSAIETASALIKEKTQLVAVTGILASFKESVKKAGEAADEAAQKYNIYTGNYGGTGLSGMTSEDKELFVSQFEEVFKPFEEKLGKTSTEALNEFLLNGNVNSLKTSNYAEEKIIGDYVEPHTVMDINKLQARYNTAKEYEKTLTAYKEIDGFDWKTEFIKEFVNKELQKRPGESDQYMENLKGDLAKKAEDVISDINIIKALNNDLKQSEKWQEENKTAKKTYEKNVLEAESYNNNKASEDLRNQAVSDLDILIKKLLESIKGKTSSEKALESFKILEDANIIEGEKSVYDNNLKEALFNQKYISTPMAATYGRGYDSSKFYTSSYWKNFGQNFKTDGSELLKTFLDSETNVLYGNTYKQQKALNALGFTDKAMTQTLRELFMDANGKWFGEDAQASNKNKLVNGYAEFTGTGSGILTAKLDALDTEGQIELLRTWIEEMGNAKAETENFNSTVEQLETSIKDTFKTSLTDGFVNTFKTIGSNILPLANNMKTMSEAAKDLANTWKDISQSILDSLGPMMAQAGLQLLPTNMEAGIALIAASGVAGILSGMLGSVNNGDDDKTERLQTLKDLLSDIIDQAKTDADYYQKNILHENAVSKAYGVTTSSVHDAVINSNGHIITTDPKDFLIATKNPGSLSGNGNVTVNFNLIDKSTGAQVSVQGVSQKKNSDGTIDIEAVVVATMNKALANGDCDKGMAAMNRRINGLSYVG